MLSNANLIKNRRRNFHKAYEIAQTMTVWRIVNMAVLEERRMILLKHQNWLFIT